MAWDRDWPGVLFLFALPAIAADLGQLRLGAGAADVLLHQLDLGRRHVNTHRPLEFEDQVFLGVAVLLQDLHAAKACDAVGQVNDKIAFAEIE